MKKIIILSFAAIFFGVAVNAQNSTAEIEQKHFLLFTAGPSFPVSDFGANDLNNEDAGMAETGFNIDLKYAYQFQQVFGFTASLAYGRYEVNKDFVHNGSNDAVSIDPWQYYGFMAGPMITGTISPRANIDLSVLSGITVVNSPKATVNHTMYMDEDWSIAAPLKVNLGFRMKFNSSGIFFIGGSYTYMQPRFDTKTQTGNLSFEQEMNLIDINAGIGFRF